MQGMRLTAPYMAKTLFLVDSLLCNIFPQAGFEPRPEEMVTNRPCRFPKIIQNFAGVRNW